MLPHDLFTENASQAVSVASTQYSTPTSEQAPPSLTSSQELAAPPSSSLTSPGTSASGIASRGRGVEARSLSASTRASSRSSSPGGRSHTRHRRHPSTSSFSSFTSTSLADLYRLQYLVRSSDTPRLLRAVRARTFLEWREVEIAARGPGGPVDPRLFGEDVLIDNAERALLDFSKRVAERRRSVAGSAADTTDEDVLASEDEDQTDVVGSFATDPVTPRCIQRPLAPVTSADDSYFPRQTSRSSSPSRSRSSALSSSSASSVSSAAEYPHTPMSASSVLVLPSRDPFHLPGLLHLVGLNFRLAVFAPQLTTPRPAWQHAAPPAPPKEGARSTILSEMGGWAWWRAAAVVGLVFVAGLATGAAAGKRIPWWPECASVFRT